MPPRAYKTLAVGLAEYADIVAEHFATSGYTVRMERDELGFPYTPTFVLKRHPTTILLEVSNKIQMERLNDWTKYGKSCGTDTRVAICLPHTVAVSAEDVAKLRDQKIGLYLSFKDRAVEQLAPADLALNVELPDRAALPRPVRELLGSAYDQFARTQWREGFEDACAVLEAESRKYLKKWSKTGRVKILRRGAPITLSARQIDKMTMGQLVNTFGQIQAQNHADSTIHKALATLNKDRIGVVHHKRKAWTEKRLRTNVGQHMWKIVAALKLLA
jgi:hypothetical protein